MVTDWVEYYRELNIWTWIWATSCLCAGITQVGCAWEQFIWHRKLALRGARIILWPFIVFLVVNGVVSARMPFTDFAANISFWDAAFRFCAGFVSAFTYILLWDNRRSIIKTLSLALQADYRDAPAPPSPSSERPSE